mgnify:CR=1 FL=1
MKGERIMADSNTTTLLTERESRLAIVLFEIMEPQIRKLIIQLMTENNQDVQTITDKTIDEQIDRKLEEKKSSEFDIYQYSGDIEDIVSDWIRYNLTLTTTVD